MNANESSNDAESTGVSIGETDSAGKPTISVRVGQLPGKIRTVQAPEAGCTVGSLLALAGLSSKDHEIRVDNQPANVNTPVRNNQTVLLIRPVKGNSESPLPEGSSESDPASSNSAETMISVRVGQLPGKIRTLQAPEAGCTVGSLLAMAELSSKDHEIRVDNQPANVNTPVRNNQTVLLIRPVKGNYASL